MQPIDMAPTNAMIDRLRAPGSRAGAVAEILADPSGAAPPVLCLLSEILCAEGDFRGAMFWFYAGQLRARFDANRCRDRSAAGAVDRLTARFGPAVNRHGFAHLDELADVVAQVLEWDRTTPHAYDHRWISLHGMAMMRATLDPSFAVSENDISQPEERWPDIAEQTRNTYAAGFRAALDAARSAGGGGG